MAAGKGEKGLGLGFRSGLRGLKRRGERGGGRGGGMAASAIAVLLHAGKWYGGEGRRDGSGWGLLGRAGPARPGEPLPIFFFSGFEFPF